MMNSKSAVRPPDAINKKKFYESPWFIVTVIVFVVVFLFYMMLDSDDVGAGNLSSTTVNFWLESELPTEAEQSITFDEWNKKATQKQKDNAARALEKAEEIMGTGGDISVLINKHTSYTGRKPGPDPDENVNHSMTFLAIINGKVYKKKSGTSDVERALRDHDARKIEKMMENDDMQDEISSFKGASFEGNSGIIKLNSGEFVKFSHRDKVELVSNEEEATRVGVLSNRLVRNEDEDEDEGGVCFPFQKSVDKNNKIKTTSELNTKSFNLERHPCLDSRTFSHDVNMNGDIIEDIGGMCFGYGLRGDGEFELGRMSCRYDNRPEAKIVNLDATGSSSANNGMGEEDVPSD